ncbi:MAG: hypothetical protein QN189_10960 [Armatimonadota bacterium]|nr:hypothetical protein [Armatimonadota bacterium]
MRPRKPPPSRQRMGRPPIRWSIYKAMIRKRLRGKRPKQQKPILRGSQVGRLVALRETIKEEAVRLSRQRLQALLRYMENRRARRLGDQATSPSPPRPIPEMIWPELYREVIWRVGILPLEDAEAVVRFIERMKRPRKLEKPVRPPQRGIGKPLPRRYTLKAPLATIAELTAKRED